MQSNKVHIIFWPVVIETHLSVQPTLVSMVVIEKKNSELSVCKLFA